MRPASVTPKSGTSAPQLLGIMFIGLKLAGVIGWSWLWVLAPFWAEFLIFVALNLWSET